MNKNNKTKRSEQKQRTREKLIQATYNVIADEGLAAVTLAKVAEKAGYARGISNFHFKNKEGLLIETLKYMYQNFQATYKDVAKLTNLSPTDKLTKIIKASLSPPIIDYRKTIVWFSFSFAFPIHDTFLEINSATDRAWENEMSSLVHQIIDDNCISYGMSVEQIITSLTTMITGFWMEFYLYPGRTTSEDAVRICLIYLSKFIPTIDNQLK